MFHVMLERENAFLEYKNEKSKVSKKLFFFLRGYSMILIFPFLFRKGKKCLSRKNAFLNNRKLKKSKNKDFSKRFPKGPWFW